MTVSLAAFVLAVSLAGTAGAAGPPSPLQARIVALRLPNLRTANLFAKGHRVGVVLSGSFLPHFSRNAQRGRPETRSGETRLASIWIRHDARHPSRLVLPVVPNRPAR